MKNHKIRAIVLLMIMSAIWGSTFPLIKSLLSNVSSFELLSLRFLFAAIISTPIILLRIRKQSVKTIIRISILGFALWMAYATQTIGLNYTTPSKSAFITGLYIIFTPIIAHLISKEKIEKRLSLSIMLSLVGLFLISGISLLEIKLVNIGDLVTIISAIAFAFQIVLTSILAKKTDMNFITGMQMLAMFILSTAANSFRINLAFPTWIIVSLILLGTVGGYLAILVETYALKHIDPGKASVIFTLEPVFALIFSVIFLREVVTAKTLIGFTLIFMSILNVAIYNKNGA